MTSSYKPGTPCWLDLGASDVDAAEEFYTSLFGWTAQNMGPEAGNYRILLKNGKQIGGIGQATDAARGSSWAIYLASDDVDATANLVTKYDGELVAGPMDVMDLGRMAVCQDPTGAYFSVWEPGKHIGAELTGAPGGMQWAECFTSDLERATSFYGEVFGLKHEDTALEGGMVYRLFTQNGAPVAGSMQITPDMGGMSSCWVAYINVEDVDATADAALAKGATQMMRETVPAGRVAWLQDPQGATICLMKPDPDFTM